MVSGIWHEKKFISWKWISNKSDLIKHTDKQNREKILKSIGIPRTTFRASFIVSSGMLTNGSYKIVKLSNH
jgi:hypothetical protein